ncbi:Clavaminate synthase-like protein [Roridomyces roridus]|uniref:Clavaminate synthase-like protein n=1 Tax=Roridomyces roridus TaxID=1738132 RepID=A0AAD7C3T1_9AGAR|nr:Clavaminate synthase-like protein [Roridomyces roridus]
MSSEAQNRPRAININQLLNPEPELHHHSHHPSSYVQGRHLRLSPPRMPTMSVQGMLHQNFDHSSHDLNPPIMPRERSVICSPAAMASDPISYPHPLEMNYSSWQTSERASSRIAASASVIKPESLNLEQRDEQALSKRKAPDVEDAEEPPRSKRKLLERLPSGTSQRVGFPSKKRREVAESNGYAPNVLYKLHDKQGDSPYTASPAEMPDKANVALELQTSRCMSSKYKNEQHLPRCVACTRRWAGDTCRFQALRSIYRNSNGNIMGFSFQEQPTPAMSMKFPNVWNTSLEMSHIQEIKKVIAEALLPTLREELAHVSKKEVICRPRELEVRATCDTCLTSIFSCSWMCRNCGREACAVCFEQVENITVEPENATPDDLQALQARRENHANGNPFFLSCIKRTDHGAKDFSPVTRFSKGELEGIIHTMEGLQLLSPAHANPHSAAPSAASPLSNDSEATLTSNGGEISSHDILRFRDNELTEEIFRPIWAKGEPILVTDVGPKLKVDWTPEYFITKYGQDTCLIVECQSDDLSKRVTVGDFFRDFGSYQGRELCWKLKDWPPTTDFKNDFSQAVPMPNYVRRDGVLNIASHFPSNTVGPDLGPKMYNANANLEEVNNKGSTRLHMDMADAVNILTYAAPRPDGSEGCAAWDIFRAEDSDKLRLFLRAKYSLTSLDPIHSQQVYVEDDARRELWLEHGVKSYRIYQTAGQAVFIPAGCAHQVRNLSDCIKVAIDFVSPENIHRCERLTREFRDLNQKRAWKEDVLQLRAMMFFCWISCCQQEEKLKASIS